MTNPAKQTLTAGTWTKVAPGVNQGQIWFHNSDAVYYHTYRDVDDPDPEGNPAASGTVAFNLSAHRVTDDEIGEPMEIGVIPAADIWIYCAENDGRITVEV